MILYFTNSHNSYLFLHSIYCNSPHHVVSVTTGEKYKRTRILQKSWPQYHQELDTYIQEQIPIFRLTHLASLWHAEC